MFQKVLFLIFSIILITSNCFAEDSIYIEKDQKAPFTGYLLPEEKIIELRNNTLDMQLYKKQGEIKDQQLTITMKQLNDLSVVNQETKGLTNWEKVGYFTAGIIVTGLAVKLAHDIYK